MSEQFCVLIASHGYVYPDTSPVRVFSQSDLDAIETLITRNTDYTVQHKFFEDNNELMKIILTRNEPDFYLASEGPATILRFFDGNMIPQGLFLVFSFRISLDGIIDTYAEKNELMVSYSYEPLG